MDDAIAWMDADQDNAENVLLQQDFGDKMVYPLITLFLDTGNQTANVSYAILERLSTIQFEAMVL
jgi:hypothetical protein